MKAPDLAVKVAGRWLHEFGHVSKVEFSTRHGDGPCGPDVATVELDLGRRPTNPGFLTLGRTLEVYDHGVLRFGGVVSGPGTGSPRVVEAKGWARTVWDATLTPEPGARIGRDAFNRPYTPADPYTPRWLLDASQFDIGVADDRLYTQVVATYISALGVDPDPDTVTSIVANDLPAQASFGLLPFALDLTSLGLISGSLAASYASQQLAEFAIPEWTTRVSVSPLELRTLAGAPAHLSAVAAGQMVRMFGLPQTFGGFRRQAATDVVLGEVSYSTDDPNAVILSPKRVAVRSLADVARQAAESRKALEAVA